LVPTHEIFLSGVGVVLRLHGEGDKYVASYAGHDASGARFVEQGQDGGERKKRTAYLGCGRSGFQDLVAAQTQLAMVAPPQFRSDWLISRLQPLDVTVSWQRFPVRNDAVGESRGR
jgi:hypothetical protein